MNRKNSIIIKILILGTLIFVFLFNSIVFASSNLTIVPSSQPRISNSLGTNNTIDLLNTLKNASFLSRLAVSTANTQLSQANIPTRSTNLSISPPAILKIDQINFHLLGDIIIAIGDDFNSDYHTYILQPIVNLETNTLVMIGNSIIYTRSSLASVNFPKINLAQISLPKIGTPNISILANAVSSDASFYNNYILKPVSDIENSILAITGDNLIKIGNTVRIAYGDFENIDVDFERFSSTVAFPKIDFPKFVFSNTDLPRSITAKNPPTLTVAVIPSPSIQSVSNLATAIGVANTVKDCGTSMAPKLDTPSTYENNPTLSCLAESAINCQDAKGTLTDNFFPTVFEINNTQSSCTFKLSYSVNSTLTDITNKKLAGEYVACPVSIVKGINDSNPSSVIFMDPDKTDLGKYGSQIYLYGTLGLFIQNNLDQNKIQSLGCSGDYINTVISSYMATRN